MIRRQVFRFPRRGYGFRGEFSREGLTDEVFQAGYLRRARNYDLIGRGRLQKRQGSTLFADDPVVAGKAVQGLALYQWGTTHKLVAVGGGAIKTLNATTGEWDTITGSVTLSNSADNFTRTTQFRDGNGAWLIGVDSLQGPLWRWKGTGNAEVFGSSHFTYAADIAEFMGRLWAINTSNGSTILEYSDDQDSAVWPAGNYLHCSRASEGVGLSRHGDNMLLVFHQRSVHGVYFDWQSIHPWAIQPIDNQVGCIAKNSIVHDQGVTYWAGQNGFYRYKGRTIEYIGHPMEDLWDNLNPDRRQHINGFVRGGTHRTICWLVSDGSSTTHNMAFIYNPNLDAWTIFDSPTGHLNLNCGGVFVDGEERFFTVGGDYTGKVWAIWGDETRSSGYKDEGATGGVVTAELQTGLLDFQYPGIKRLKEIWIDAVVRDSKTFEASIVGLGELDSVSETGELGVTGARLDVDFYFDVSPLGSGDTPTQGHFTISSRSRAFQLSLKESSEGIPQVINSLMFWWMPRGQRFNP